MVDDCPNSTHESSVVNDYTARKTWKRSALVSLDESGTNPVGLGKKSLYVVVDRLCWKSWAATKRANPTRYLPAKSFVPAKSSVVVRTPPRWSKNKCYAVSWSTPRKTV